MSKNKKDKKEDFENGVLVKDFKAKNLKQSKLIKMIKTKEVILASGQAGCGKTYVALATALQLLGEQFKQIILVKSVTTLPDEEIGFIKGDVSQKMEPFMMSYTWNIDKILEKGSAKKLMDKKVVEVLPLAFIRGLSIDNSIVIIDEAQNLSKHSFKTIMTRIGENSKYIFLGDTEQIDKKRKEDSCLQLVMDIFKDSEIIGTVEFADSDCVRNPIIPEILTTLKEYNI